MFKKGQGNKYIDFENWISDFELFFWYKGFLLFTISVKYRLSSRHSPIFEGGVACMFELPEAVTAKPMNNQPEKHYDLCYLW